MFWSQIILYWLHCELTLIHSHSLPSIVIFGLCVFGWQLLVRWENTQHHFPPTLLSSIPFELPEVAGKETDEHVSKTENLPSCAWILTSFLSFVEVKRRKEMLENY